MTGLADVRPAGIDVLFRPATTVTLTLEWPAGELAGRTFTSTLDGEGLAVTVVDDTMTVEATDTQTGALTTGVPVEWQLLEDIDGTDEPILIGTWTPSDDPRAVSSTTLQVTVGSATVEVSVSSAQASIAALDARVTTAEADIGQLQTDVADLQTDVGELETAVVEHSWARDGWDPFTTVVATADGDQQFVATVEAGRGRVTGTEPGDGNHRVFYLHPGTDWERARITAVWWGPSTWEDSPTNRPQIGFVFGAQETSPGRWVALVCWYNIVAALDPSGLVINGWDVDGTDLTLGDGGGAGGLINVNRTGVVLRAEHLSFGAELSVMRVAPSWAAIIDEGTPVTVEEMADSEYDVADADVSQAAPADINVTVPLDAAPTIPIDQIAGGIMTPASPWIATPYVVCAERDGPTIRVTQWAYGAARPEPGDTYRWDEVTVTQGAMSAFPTGPGLHGLMIGHCHDGSWAEVGDIRFERR